jgi:hypothetical protein
VKQLLLVAVGKAQEESSPRQRFQTVSGKRGDLDPHLRCQVCGALVIFAEWQPTDQTQASLGSVNLEQIAQVRI